LTDTPNVTVMVERLLNINCLVGKSIAINMNGDKQTNVLRVHTFTCSS